MFWQAHQLWFQVINSSFGCCWKQFFFKGELLIIQNLWTNYLKIFNTDMENRGRQQACSSYLMKSKKTWSSLSWDAMWWFDPFFDPNMFLSKEVNTFDFFEWLFVYKIKDKQAITWSDCRVTALYRSNFEEVWFL